MLFDSKMVKKIKISLKKKSIVFKETFIQLNTGW
jgi:hypothetical protein